MVGKAFVDLGVTFLICFILLDWLDSKLRRRKHEKERQ